ncbi:putative Monocarboxylate transporter 12 [Hypsibius exemplaris]|uniref:Monocarboxylate transporter 12 n=1 Tax=Hypsibius exemplaris TaxID=2072580 RepID=A0A1W0WCF5_HYPEX|nr:putative Monocarboxylate transporter 12 [Hypsibius exemplaris]
MERLGCISAAEPAVALLPVVGDEEIGQQFINQTMKSSVKGANGNEQEEAKGAGKVEAGLDDDDNIRWDEARRKRNMDKGWAWAVLFGAFVIHAVVFGIAMGMGIFYSEFLDEFHRGPVATSWLIATHCALGTLSGPIGSILANRLGFRPVTAAGALIASLGFVLSYFATEFWMLFLCFGAISGLGLGITYAPSFGILALYFDKRKTAATAACSIGIGVGMLLIPPLERLMISSLTWRGATLILAGITLNMVPCSLLFTEHEQAKPKAAPSFSQSADVSLFKKMSFYVVLANFFLMGAFQIFMIIGIRFAMDEHGVSKDNAPLLISVQGIFSICGRLSAVVIGLNRWTSGLATRYTLFHVGTFLAAVFIGVFPVMPTFLGLCALSGGVGFFLGLRYALLPSIMIEIFTPKRFSTSWSYGMAMMGVGSLLMPPLSEWTAQLAGSSRGPFYICTGSMLIACFGGLILQYCLQTLKRNPEIFALSSSSLKNSVKSQLL